LLNLLGRQRKMIGSVIEIRHLTIRPQLLQNPAELWCAVCILRSAQSYNSPMKLRMGKYVATAPECLIVGVGDDNGGQRPRVRLRLIERIWEHCFPRQE
jgi:hypothetical protein